MWNISHADREHIHSLVTVAKKYGQISSSTKMSAGNYACSVDTSKSKLTCRLNSLGGGGHQAIWDIFANEVKRWSEEILSVSTETSENKQEVAGKLSKLEQNVRLNGSWLTYIRNEVNYRQSFGCWYPYKCELPKFSKIAGKTNLWLADPMSIDLAVRSENDLQAFQNTCLFIVGLCRAMMLELADRCPGKSFSTYRPVAFLNLARSRAVKSPSLAVLME